MKPIVTELKYSYKKPGADVWVLNIDDLPISKDSIKDQQIVHLAPQSVGGNHKHPRTEWFIGIGELYFIWFDEAGTRYEQHMHPQGKILLVEVPTLLPHAVVNKSATQVGVLFEMADGKMKGAESTVVYEFQ